MERAANTQELVPIKEIKENAIILNDGSLRQVLMVGGMNFSLKSEEEQGAIVLAYQNFLNSLDFPLQIIVHSRKINIEKYLASLEKYRENEPSPLLQNQIGEYHEFIKTFVQENAIMGKTFFAVVPFTPIALPEKEMFLRFLPFIKKGDAAKKAREAARTVAEGEDFEKNLGQLNQRVQGIQDGLSAVGLETVLLADEELVELLYNFYNPEAVEKESVVPTGTGTPP